MYKPKESSIVQKITMSIMYLGIGGIFLLLFIQSARLINTRFFKFTDAYFLTDFWLTRIYLGIFCITKSLFAKVAT